MKVKDLIEILLKLDQDLEIYTVRGNKFHNLEVKTNPKYYII